MTEFNIPVEEWRSSAKCSAFQAKAVLAGAELLSTVETWVSGQDAMVQLAYATAVEWKRNSNLVAAAAAALELTEGQVDNLFLAAMVIEV